MTDGEWTVIQALAKVKVNRADDQVAISYLMGLGGWGQETLFPETHAPLIRTMLKRYSRQISIEIKVLAALKGWWS